MLYYSYLCYIIHIYALFKHSWADTICIFSRTESVTIKKTTLVKQVLFKRTNILIPFNINCIICFSLCLKLYALEMANRGLYKMFSVSKFKINLVLCNY